MRREHNRQSVVVLDGEPAGPAPADWREWIEKRLAVEPEAVRAIVLLTDAAAAVEYPVVETLFPCPVLSLPRLLALAALAPAEWPRFAILEEPGGRCGLATRSSGARYFFAESAAPGSLDAARAFGDQQVVWGGEAGGIPAAERIADGAARLALAALEAHGVSFGGSAERPVVRLAVRSGPAYDVVHTSGVFDPGDDSLARLVADRPALLAVDRNVMKLYGRAIRAYAAARLDRFSFAQVRPGDATKTWSQVAYLCEQAQRAELPRHGVVVGIGGGVALDVAGMTAALYRRGVRYLRLPTTLLAMVDVAVGIKQAINFSGRKSLLGAFYPAMGAVNDLGLLKTLPRAEIANGFAEIIKLGLVRDRILFEWVERHAARLAQSAFQDPPEWARRIALRAEYLMMAELQPNLFEAGLRRLADFGHTFSPAIEEASDYLVPHGEAVAFDMLLSAIIAVRRSVCAPETLQRLIALYRVLGLLVLPPACDLSLLARALEKARSQRGGSLAMVLPAGLGEGCFADEVAGHELRHALITAAGVCQSRSSASYAGAGR
jgi:3-dehydroquinate synthetase